MGGRDRELDGERELDGGDKGEGVGREIWMGGDRGDG